MLNICRTLHPRKNLKDRRLSIIFKRLTFTLGCLQKIRVLAACALVASWSTAKEARGIARLANIVDAIIMIRAGIQTLVLVEKESTAAFCALFLRDSRALIARWVALGAFVVIGVVENAKRVITGFYT
jgi:hypothetical protein